MKIYLAGSMDRRDELKHYADELISLGFIITSRWLWMNDDPVTDDDKRHIAMRNVNDLLAADTVFVFVDPQARTQGGHHFDHGFAYALHALGMCQVELVGKPENVYHEVAGVKRHDTWGAAVGALGAP